MHKILILGAGRSSTTLIQHLLNTTSPSEFQVTVADENISLAQEKIGNREGKAISLNVEDTQKLNTLIQENNLVIFDNKLDLDLPRPDNQSGYFPILQTDRQR